MKGNIKLFYLLASILCLLLCAGRATYALPQDSLEAAAPVIVRLPDPQKLEAMRHSSDFQYYEEVKPATTLLERLWQRLGKWLQDVFYKGRASNAWIYLIYALILGGIAFIVIRMQQIDVGSFFGKNAGSTPMPYDVYEENIHEMDMAALIEEAVTQHNYRKAVRLHYLQSLKVLTEKDLIYWKPGKTNRSYMTEIRTDSIRRDFEKLTNMFEYVWYGGSALSEELFTAARNDFRQFDQMVKQHA
jgi:hypothetical protein